MMKIIEVKPGADHVSRWLDPDVLSLHRFSPRSRIWRPPTDVFETETSVVVRVEIAGMREAEFSILLEGHRMSIQGKRQDDNIERRSYHQMEIHFGEFCSQLELPWPVETEDVEAEYQDGFLWVRLSKANPRQIKVKE